MSNTDLLLDPEGYAKRAIESIKDQLTTCKSKKKASRLQTKKTQWEKMLELSEDKNEKGSK